MIHKLRQRLGTLSVGCGPCVDRLIAVHCLYTVESIIGGMEETRQQSKGSLSNAFLSEVNRIDGSIGQRLTQVTQDGISLSGIARRMHGNPKDHLSTRAMISLQIEERKQINTQLPDFLRTWSFHNTIVDYLCQLCDLIQMDTCQTA
jgi:hypothetical protein